MPKETVIVGDEKGRFRYNSRGFCGNGYCEDAVALVFARDRHKSSGSYYCVYLCGTICYLMRPKWIKTLFSDMHIFYYYVLIDLWIIMGNKLKNICTINRRGVLCEAQLCPIIIWSLCFYISITLIQFFTLYTCLYSMFLLSFCLKLWFSITYISLSLFFLGFSVYNKV